MSAASEPQQSVALAPALGAEVGDFIALLKPRVMVLVAFTGLAGMVVAPGTLHPLLMAVALLCITVGAGAAGGFNMWYERAIDARMARTRDRPLVQGRVAADDALAFVIVLAAASVAFLGIAVNWLAAGLLAVAIFYYAVVYTIWLKPRTPENIVIGGGAGAFPPIIGWAAVTGGLDWPPVALFLLIFFWTPPHFWALAIDRAEDYRRAGIPMLPVVKGGDATRRRIVWYTLTLPPLSAVPYLLGSAGIVYLIGAVVLGLVFVAATIQLWRVPSRAAALRVFGFSIAYLFLVFGLLMVDATHGPLHALLLRG